jgi:hypothetical protein
MLFLSYYYPNYDFTTTFILRVYNLVFNSNHYVIRNVKSLIITKPQELLTIAFLVQFHSVFWRTPRVWKDMAILMPLSFKKQALSHFGNTVKRNPKPGYLLWVYTEIWHGSLALACPVHPPPPHPLPRDKFMKTSVCYARIMKIIVVAWYASCQDLLEALLSEPKITENMFCRKQVRSSHR